MLITNVTIKLVARGDSKLLAFASLTIDHCFLIRDIKIVQGNTTPIVAMPSRKITDRCKQCGSKNHLHAQFCNQCGTRLPSNRARPDERGRTKLHADIIHPITSDCRRLIQSAVLKGYEEELRKSKSPEYVAPRLDDDEDLDDVPVSGGSSSALRPATVYGSKLNITAVATDSSATNESAPSSTSQPGGSDGDLPDHPVSDPPTRQ